jgi:hypothetical protein
VTRKTLTWGHVAFDTSGLFTKFSRKIDVCLDSPYLQHVASIRKMPTYLGMPSHAARASGGSKEPTTSSSSS